MNRTILKNKKGFTLIEILMVIVVFGLLAAMAVLALNNARRDTRDMKRVADISVIQSALELYFYNCNHYPTAITPGNPISGQECDGGVYLRSVPADPNGSIYRYTPCIGTAEYHCAPGQESANWYELEYQLEGQSSGLRPGNHIATPFGK